MQQSLLALALMKIIKIYSHAMPVEYNI